MRRVLAPFQHVEPPRIVGEMHADVVRDKIEDQAEVVLFECRAQSLKTGLAAELRIEPGVIDDVVAMGAALARLHERRGVDMADAERLQIRDDGGGRVEVEIRRELQAIGRDRKPGGITCLRYARTPTRASCARRSSPPQIGVPVGSSAVRRSAVPTGWPSTGASRRRPSASSPSASRIRRLRAAEAAPASRGTISCRRTERSFCTSASRSRPRRSHLPVQHRGSQGRSRADREFVAIFRIGAGEFPAPPLADGLGEIALEIAEKRKRCCRTPFLAHEQHRHIGASRVIASAASIARVRMLSSRSPSARLPIWSWFCRKLTKAVGASVPLGSPRDCPPRCADASP